MREWVDFPGATYVEHDDEAEILPGVRLLPAPGHTAGHQIVVVETDEGPVVLGGDVGHSFEELERGDSPVFVNVIRRRRVNSWPHRLSSSAMDDLGSPSSYRVLEPGTAVFSSDEARVGDVQHVLADYDLDVFDGIVMDAAWLPGGLRFADASQVDQIYEKGVVLLVGSADAERLPEPSDNPGSIEIHGVEDVDASELHEKLRRAWQVVSGGGS